MENNDFDINFDDSFIAYIFLNYQRRKKEKRLYSSDDHIPQNIIKSYYLMKGRPCKRSAFAVSFLQSNSQDW